MLADETGLIGVILRPFDSTLKRDPGRYRNRIEKDLTLLRSTDGVVDVVLAHAGIPMYFDRGANPRGNVRIAGTDSRDGVPVAGYSANVNTLDFLGITLIEGRKFTSEDVSWVDTPQSDGGPNVIIAEDLAKRLFPEASALGNRLVFSDGKELTVVGIVKNLRSVFGGIWKDSSMLIPGKSKFNEGYLVRTGEGAAAGVARMLNERLLAADRDREIIVEDFSRIKRIMYYGLYTTNAIVITVSFLLIAITALGNYAYMSCSVVKRTNVIGIRRALGATRNYILGYLITENTLITLLGILPGLGLMLALNISPSKPITSFDKIRVMFKTALGIMRPSPD